VEFIHALIVEREQVLHESSVRLDQ
jgi:hypothetical protein